MANSAGSNEFDDAPLALVPSAEGEVAYLAQRHRSDSGVEATRGFPDTVNSPSVAPSGSVSVGSGSACLPVLNGLGWEYVRDEFGAVARFPVLMNEVVLATVGAQVVSATDHSIDLMAPGGGGVQMRSSAVLVLLKPEGSLMSAGEPLARHSGDRGPAWLDVRLLDRHGAHRSPESWLDELALAGMRMSDSVVDPFEFDRASLGSSLKAGPAISGSAPSTLQIVAVESAAPILQPAASSPAADDDLPIALSPHDRGTGTGGAR